ncbi:class I SAM-dependent methyltransferase [candidate division KSB1 bacterium]|nr:class I SAM-dependent methyltransferase [candidate division KSB1 bacterium]
MTLLKIFKKIGTTATHDRNAYWEYQRSIGRYYWETILQHVIRPGRALDIGCGEGGVLSFFADLGFECYGLDNNKERVEYAQSFPNSKIRFMHTEIENFRSDVKFDLILMLDVIEHINDKEKALLNIKNCLSEKGIFLLTFPPFHSPFGGHQQILSSFLKYIPYWHVLPRCCLLWLLKKFEKQHIDARLEIVDRGLTIKQFEVLARNAGLVATLRMDYLIRPRQALRFGTRIIRNRFPLLKEWLSTGSTYILAEN